MARGTVLVVDDDAAVVGVLAEILELEGYRAVAARGTEALRLAHELHPDVVLLDLVQPDIGGEELSHRLRGDPATAHIPLIAMSGHERLRGPVPLPVDDRLPKPFDIDALCATVARWVPGAPEKPPVP